MKKIIFVVLIIAVIVGYFVLRDNTPTNIETATKDTVTTGRPDPSNATFILDGVSVTLRSGKFENNLEEVTIFDEFAYGDINADRKQDTALLLTQYGGGSGTFIYVAAFISGPVTYRGSEAIFIGDRIEPQSISINGGVITVKYLDRRADDAFAVEPTIPMSKQFVYKNGEFQEK